MLKRVIATAGLVTVITSASSAAQPVPSPGSTEAATKAAGVKDGDRLVCRRVQNTGTRFSERVCKTRRELAQAAEAARNSTDDFHERNRRNTVKPDGGQAYNRHLGNASPP